MCQPIIYSKQSEIDRKMKVEFNINCFSNLDRTNLQFGIKERRLLLKEFSTGEKLYIQYPGKETIANKRRPERPWDFRPKIILANGDKFDDLSFKAIWNDIYSLKKYKIDMSDIATIFFRMATMLDSTITSKKLFFEDITPDNEVLNSGEINFSWYEYNPPIDILNRIEKSIKKLHNISLPAYLAYNDLLAQNEDCKYFYVWKEEKKSKWDYNIGRLNTIYTHINLIQFIDGKETFSKIIDQFMRGRGVAPINRKLIPEITQNKVLLE